MRRLFSTLVAVALLLGLGALAVLARPNASAPAVPAAALPAPAPVSAAAPDAPDALKYNDISVALILDGVTDAKTLANFIHTNQGGSFIKRVLRYDAPTQAFEIYEVGDDSTNFSVSVGQALFLLVDSTAPATVSLVGGVPDKESVSFTLTSGSPAKYNFLSLPLDRDDLTKASGVATDMGAGVDRVLRYDGASQTYEIHEVGDSSTDFDLKIGEPFAVLLSTGAPSTWP